MTLQMIVRDAMVESRNDALEAAIKVCEEVMKQGGGAAQCVVALRRLRAAFSKTDGVER
jgi:hypothetical protein